MVQVSNTFCTPFHFTHAATPELLVVHFSSHLQLPVWQTGSHAPLPLGVHPGTGMLQARSRDGPSSVLPPSGTTPPRQQWPSTQA